MSVEERPVEERYRKAIEHIAPEGYVYGYRISEIAELYHIHPRILWWLTSQHLSVEQRIDMAIRYHFIACLGFDKELDRMMLAELQAIQREKGNYGKA